LHHDIGAYQRNKRSVSTLLQKSYSIAKYSGLIEILDEFLHEAGTVDIIVACFALDGRVSGRRVKLTSLPLKIDADTIAARFAIGRRLAGCRFDSASPGL